MDAYTKRPDDLTKVVFDMRSFVAEVDPNPVTFLLKVEEGIFATDVSTTPGLIELEIGGGRTGRVYLFGIEATTSDGQSRTDMRRMRLVDPSEWPIVDTTPVPVGSNAPQSQYADNYADAYA